MGAEAVTAEAARGDLLSLDAAVSCEAQHLGGLSPTTHPLVKRSALILP